MHRHSHRRTRWLILALAILAAAAFSPSYTRVIVKGDGVNVDVEKAGFGPQRVYVETDGARVDSSTR